MSWLHYLVDQTVDLIKCVMINLFAQYCLLLHQNEKAVITFYYIITCLFLHRTVFKCFFQCLELILMSAWNFFNPRLLIRTQLATRKKIRSFIVKTFSNQKYCSKTIFQNVKFQYDVRLNNLRMQMFINQKVHNKIITIFQQC